MKPWHLGEDEGYCSQCHLSWDECKCHRPVARHTRSADRKPYKSQKKKYVPKKPREEEV